MGIRVKKRDLERELTKLGWYLKRHGNKHDRWTDGEMYETVPRHNEIDEELAQKILKTARISFQLRRQS